MKEFWAFIKKEFFHILRDKRTMLILLGMPVVQILLFGFAISTEIKDARLMILGYTGEQAQQDIVARLDQNPYLRVTGYLDSYEQAQKAFNKNEVEMIVVFSRNFSKKTETGGASLQLLTDGTDPNTAHMINTYVRNVLQMELQRIKGIQASSYAVPTFEVHMLFNPQMNSAYNFVPGVMGLILMLICTMMTSISIVREKESGTMEVLLVSPVRPIWIFLAKAVPYFLLSCINLITIMLLSVYVLDVPVSGSLSLLFLTSILLILVALSLGLLVSTLARTQVAAMLISGMVLLMPVMLLSGIIFPTESMPLLLQWLSHFIPAKWYIMAVKKIMIEGVGIGYVYPELLILTFMGAVLISVSLKLFKQRLE